MVRLRLVFFSFVLIFSASDAYWLFAASWSKNKIWDDGRAEVAFYQSERVVYGKPRLFQEQLIVVKEDLREDTLVKADNPKAQKTIRVLKLNQVQKFETENYPYSYMTSVFLTEAEGREVVKMTVGSQEWCGNTFKIYIRKPGESSGQLKWNSYFDGEADQTVALEITKDDYFDDQLSVSLRALPFKTGYQEKIRLWDSLTTSHGQTPLVQEATLSISEGEPVRCRAGSLPAWKVTIQKANGADYYWFEKADPHLLVKMETSDGRKRLLLGRARWSYWDRRIPKPKVLN